MQNHRTELRNPNLKSYFLHQQWRIHPHGYRLFKRNGEKTHKEVYMHIGHRFQMVSGKHLRKRQITSVNWASSFGFILVEDLPSKLSLGHWCNKLESSYSWSPRGTPELIKRTKIIEFDMDR